MAETIGWYNKRFVLIRFLPLAMFLIVLWALELRSFAGGNPEQLISERPLLLPLMLISYGFGVITVFAFSVLIKHLFLEKGKALWVQNGTVIFLHRWALSANCDDIAQISIGKFGRYNSLGIILNLKDGTQRNIPVAALTEPPEVIAARLRKHVPC